MRNFRTTSHFFQNCNFVLLMIVIRSTDDNDNTAARKVGKTLKYVAYMNHFNVKFRFSLNVVPDPELQLCKLYYCAMSIPTLL